MEKEIGKFKIVTNYDEDPENPRMWDNLGTMICFHRRYNLGDKNNEINKSDFASWDEVKRHIMKNNDVAVILPLYLYDHSGLTMNTTGFSCPWDSGQVGFIFVTKENARKMYNWKLITKSRKELLKSYLNGEVETYDQYLRGEIFEYKIYNKDDNSIVDSCSGFYDEEECVNEAKGIIDSMMSKSCVH